MYTQARTDAELLTAIHDIVVQHGSYVGQINRKVVSSFVHDPELAARTAGIGTIAILAMQGLVVSNMVGASMGAHRDLIGAFADLLEQQRTTPPGSAAAIHVPRRDS